MAYLHWIGFEAWERLGKPNERLTHELDHKNQTLSVEFVEAYAANYTKMLQMVQSIYPKVGWGAAAGAAAEWGCC
jgi:hypothetical protein